MSGTVSRAGLPSVFSHPNCATLQTRSSEPYSVLLFMA